MSKHYSFRFVISICVFLMLFYAIGSSAIAFDTVLSGQNLTVDGSDVQCEKYNIDGSNYFKLRDLAYLMNGTGSQFSVGWDQNSSTVSIKTGESYTPNGTELTVNDDQSKTAQISSQTITINGTVRDDLTVYNIGGNNYFQLRQLGQLLGFAVDFDGASNTAIINSIKSAVKEQLSSGIRPEFKEMVDSYEKFMNEYIDFMNRYYTSGNALGMMSDYLKYVESYTELVSKIDAVDESELTMEELTYYLETINRVNQRLAEIKA